MHGTIRVTSPCSTKDYKALATADDIHHVMALSKDTGGLSPRTICFIPARTDLAHIAQDLFFPLVIHVALKIKNTVKKVLFVTLYALIDCVTLAVRLATLIPRHISIKMRTPHIFAQYLKEKNAPKELVKAPQVDLLLEWREEGLERPRQLYRRVPLTEMPPHEVIER